MAWDNQKERSEVPLSLAEGGLLLLGLGEWRGKELSAAWREESGVALFF